MNRHLAPILSALTTGYDPVTAGFRKVIAMAGIDPIVTYPIGGVTLRIPLSHELPRIRARYPAYGANQATLAAFLLEKYPSLSVIDIGANIGDTIALWRGVGDFPVLAVEASERYLRLLRSNEPFLGDVTVHPAIVGQADGDAYITTEESRGTARIVAADDRRTVTRLTSLIAARPAFRAAKLVKIDTDGNDGEVIIGGREWIGAARPAIFFEFSPFLADGDGQPLLGAVEVLCSLGYQQLLFYDNTGEFTVTVEASERSRIEELHAHALAWGEERYWDVAAFHEDDRDVAHRLRSRELMRIRA